MKIKGLLTDRQPLIDQLSREMGMPAVYAGAPSFRYSIGDYTVLRDGCLSVDDDKADADLLERMMGLGLIHPTVEGTGHRCVL